MATIYVTISKNSPNLEVLEVIENREKSLKVRNKDNNAVCFLPKSGLLPRRPGVPTYEDEFILADWFAGKLSNYQERVLGILE